MTPAQRRALDELRAALAAAWDAADFDAFWTNTLRAEKLLHEIGVVSKVEARRKSHV